MSRKLTPQSENDRAEFQALDGCSCHISPPCGYCVHPGNPMNQDEVDSCWEVSP